MSHRNPLVLDEADSGESTESSDEHSNSEPSHSDTDSGSYSSEKSEFGTDSSSSKSGNDSDSSRSSYQDDGRSCSSGESDDDHVSQADEDEEISDGNESTRRESLTGRNSRHDHKASRSKDIGKLEGKLGIFKKLGRQGGIREEPSLELTEEQVTSFFLRKSPFVEPDYGLATENGPLNIKWIANQYRKFLENQELGFGVVVEQKIWAVFAKVAEETNRVKDWHFFFHENDKLRWSNIVKTYFQCPLHISLVRCEGVKIWWQLYCSERNRERWLHLKGEQLLTKMRLKSQGIMPVLSRIFFDQKSRGFACALLVKLADAASVLDELPLEIFDDARETLSSNWLMWSKRLSLPQNLHKYYGNAIQGSNNEDDEATCAARLSNEKLYKLYKTSTIWTSSGNHGASAGKPEFSNAIEAQESAVAMKKDASLLKEARTQAGYLLSRERVDKMLLEACGSTEKANELAIGWLSIAAELKNKENSGGRITEEEILLKWNNLNRYIFYTAASTITSGREALVEEITAHSANDSVFTLRASVEPTLARESSVLDAVGTESTGETCSQAVMKRRGNRQKDSKRAKESEHNESGLREDTRSKSKYGKKKEKSSKIKKRGRLVIFSDDSDGSSESRSPTEKGTPKKRKLHNK